MSLPPAPGCGLRRPAAMGPDGPLLFCTCAGIRGPGARRTAYQRVWGWADIAAARAGHQAVTSWIAEMAAFLAGRASVLPPSDPALPALPPGAPQLGRVTELAPSPGAAARPGRHGSFG